jgi:hypothetical protein
VSQDTCPNKQDVRFQVLTAASSESSELYYRVLNWMSTDVSEVRAASIVRAMSEPNAKG